MTEEELKKLFKSNLESREFEFNPDNWKAMEAMLDGKDSRGAGFYWRSAAAILGFGLLVGSLIFLQPHLAPSGENSQTNEPIENIAGDDTSANPTDENSGSNMKASPIAPSDNESGSSAGNVSQGDLAASPAVNENEDKAATDKPTSGEGGSSSVGSKSDQLSESSSIADGGGRDELQLTLLPIKAYENISVELGMLPREVSGGEITPGQFTPNALSKFQGIHEFYLLGGAVATGSHTDNSTGLGWTGGIAYKYRIATQFSLDIGLQYSVQNNVGITEHKDSIFYHFGRETVENKRMVQRLEYVEIPLQLSWQINPKHEVGAGAYAGQLISVTEDLTRIHTKPKDAPETTNNSFKGYDEDFRRYDYGLSFSYYYQIHPALSVGLQLRQGLADITKDISEDFGTVHQNSSARMTLRYRIF